MAVAQVYAKRLGELGMEDVQCRASVGASGTARGRVQKFGHGNQDLESAPSVTDPTRGSVAFCHHQLRSGAGTTGS